jgi:hypothetical protein
MAFLYYWDSKDNGPCLVDTHCIYSIMDRIAALEEKIDDNILAYNKATDKWSIYKEKK